MNWWVIVGVAIAATVPIAIPTALRAAHLRLRIVRSDSMVPTLRPGDLIIVTDRPGLSEHVRPGDLITYDTRWEQNEPATETVVAIKRLAAIVRADIATSSWHADENRGEWLVVLGDNARASHDSRHFGPIPKTALTGVAVAVVWPFRRIGGLR